MRHPVNTMEFTSAFDKFLTFPHHFELVSAKARSLNCFADPTSFFVKFLNHVFCQSRSLVQFEVEEMLFPMCTAYRNIAQLDFNLINQGILADALKCRTDEQLMELLTSTVVRLRYMKLDAWNTEIRTNFAFQLNRSDGKKAFNAENQETLAPLYMRVDGTHRTVTFSHKVCRDFAIGNIQFRGVVTTSKTHSKMIEFSGEWWWCEPTPGRGVVRRSALFRIRGKPLKKTDQSNELNPYALVDLFGNYLDRRQAYKD